MWICSTRVSRSAVRSVLSDRIASATANSAASPRRRRVAAYSPTQNEVTGTADSTPGQVVQEPAERPRVALIGAQGLEAVDHHQPGPAVFEQIGDPGQHPGQSLVVQGLAQVLVDDAAAEHRGVEVLQGLAVPQDLLQRFGHGGQVQRRMLLGRVVEQVLLRQDRLARARCADQQRDAVQRQPTIQHGVQPGRTAGQSIGHRAGPFPRR